MAATTTDSPVKPANGTLVPYYTPTPQILPTLQAQATLAPIPSPTPTPRTHKLTNSDTLFALAGFYGVTIEEILTANPGLDRDILPAGKDIIIPPSKTTGQGTPVNAPTLTVLPFGSINCLRSQEGGMWCFLPVTNDQPHPLENVSAQIRIEDQTSGKLQTMIGTTPLNLLHPGQTLPVTVYFPAPQPLIFRMDAQLISALPVPADDQRYTPVNIGELQINIEPGGHSAVIKTEVNSKDGKSSKQVWMAAIAYDRTGKMIGSRRWKSTNEIPAGKSLPVEFTIYSVTGEIEKVECFAEAIK
ncbi:MAG: LysM peptidoglycan-binding domain-containing protein [Anaerolineaceae bacterium]|nr:LysM peptidoglycan-binding domain-containing protein [Anaerolineaceae bacterium]